MLKIVGKANAPQLLLIHGGGVGSWMWDDCLSYLTPHYQIILVSLPYHDDKLVTSSRPFTIHSFALKLIEQLPTIRNQHPLGVVGFSLGAQITLELLAIAPKFFSFAMINSALCTNINIPFSLLKLLSTLTMPLAKVKSFAKLQSKSLYIPNHLFASYFKLSSTMTSQQLAEVLHTNMTYKLSPMIQTSTSKVYISYGENENRAIKKSAKMIEKQLASSTTYIVKGIGHGFPLAEPLQFSDFILKHFII